MEKLPNFKNEEEKKKFFEATKYVENKQGINPEEKYKTGSIQGFNEEAMKSGEYEPYTDKIIKETKEQIDQILSEVEQDKKATFSLSEEHKDPEAFREKNLQDLEEDNAA
ncbi:MAG TPA: hypothetical protein VK153_03045 [Candidatus Paceibacterota bacterium]|nr:hypothetical protein [Candidatus Paceibacterota bacterium]